MSPSEDEEDQSDIKVDESQMDRTCDFGCDLRFSSEEEFFIHVTDYHNSF